MARAAVMNETDDDGSYEPTDTQLANDLPPGLTGATDSPRQPDAGDQDFQIVDTDDDFRPLTGPAAPPREEIRTDADPQPRIETPRERQSKAQRRASQRAARERSESELQTYRDENARLRADFEALQGRVTPRLDQIDQARLNDQLSGITREIETAATTVDQAISRASEAMAAGDAAGHAAALRDVTRFTQRGNELTTQKAQLEAQRASREHQPDTRAQPRTEQTRAQPQPQVQQNDPIVAERVREYAAEIPWLKTRTLPNGTAVGTDRDSRIMLAIDQEVAAEGYDPRDDDYWDEIDGRARESLPHRFQQQQTQRRPAQQSRPQQPVPPQRRGPMVAGAGGGGASNGGPRQVLLSPERKNAMIQAGVLDPDGSISDKKRFNRLAAGYAEFDRVNGVARQ
jgi:hypothetical protein